MLDGRIDNLSGWTLVNDKLVANKRGLTAVKMLGEDFEREAANNGACICRFSLTMNLI